MTRIVVISAGVSVPSSTKLLADMLGDAAASALSARGDEATVTHIELRGLAHPLTDHLLSGFASPELTAAYTEVRQADALVMVTPVFSASYNGLFKMFVDLMEPGLIDGKPVLVAATGGTARHSLVLDHALRPLLSYLHAVVVPTAIFAATDDFGDSGLRKRIDRAAAELAALTAGSGAPTPRRELVEDRFAAPVEFEELLRRASEG